MTIKFYLDKPNATGETAIYLFLRFGKSTLKFNTGKRIHPSLWNSANPSSHFRKFVGSVEMNTWLDSLKASINKTYYGKEQWLKDELKSEILQIINGRAPRDTNKEFLDTLRDFVTSKEANNALARTTIKKYKTLFMHLLAFSNDNKHVLGFEKINRRFFEDFSGYLRNELKHTNNTVNKYLKTLKTFIHWAVDNGYTTSDVVSTKFTISDDPTEIITLSWDELMSIYSLELPLGSALDRARDVFCFGCFTGQRFSDIKNLKAADIILSNRHGSSQMYWILHQIKGKITIQNEIPMNEYAMEIIRKYKGDEKPLPVISNQKTNEHVKALGNLAQIDESIKVVKYSGKDRIELRQPKYQFLGTHTARRTFITLSLEKGMRPEMVMAISGHADYKTMKRYIAITNKMKANEMHVIWSKPSVTKRDRQLG